MPLRIGGRLRIGPWRPAWLYEPTWTSVFLPGRPSRVRRVIAAPWTRRDREDWVWREPDRAYDDPSLFGGSLYGSHAWGVSLFESEAEAWERAVAGHRATLDRIDLERRRAEAELQDAEGMLALARLRVAP